MAQNVEELLAPLPNMLSQIQQDGDSSPKGVSQFKAPLRLQSSVQPGKLLEQGRPSSIQGSTSSKGVSQFKAPLRLQSSVQPGKLLEQGQLSSSFGEPPFNRASQLFGSTIPLPSAQIPPSVGTYASYSADAPITTQNSILAVYPTRVPATLPSGLSALLPPLERQRQRPFPQPLKLDQSQRPARPRSEAWVKPQTLYRTKIRIMMRIILFGGTMLLVGGIASFLLLHSPTYLVVTWVLLIIVLSNLVSQELRAYYRLTQTAQRLVTVRPSANGNHMGRNPLLKDISDTTGYLKALCLVFKNDHPV